MIVLRLAAGSSVGSSLLRPNKEEEGRDSINMWTDRSADCLLVTLAHCLLRWQALNQQANYFDNFLRANIRENPHNLYQNAHFFLRVHLNSA